MPASAGGDPIFFNHFQSGDILGNNFPWNISFSEDISSSVPKYRDAFLFFFLQKFIGFQTLKVKES